MNQATSPLISVIMPCYNAAEYLTAALNSVLNQTHANLEVLVCDDASTDGTRELIEQITDKRVRTFFHTENKGYLLTCNFLFEQANGEFIAFQDADDYSLPHRFEKALRVLDQHPDFDFSTSDYSLISKNGEPMATHILQVDFDAYRSNADYTLWFCGATLFLRKKVLEKVGGYHPFFSRMGGEDYEWLFRIVQHFKGIHTNEVLYAYRMYDSPVKLYNIRNARYETFLAHPIIDYVRRVYIEKGIYLLQDTDPSALQHKIKELAQPFLKDPSLFYRTAAIRMTGRKDWGEIFDLAKKAFITNPTSLLNYVLPFQLAYIGFRRSIPFQVLPNSLRKTWKGQKH